MGSRGLTRRLRCGLTIDEHRTQIRLLYARVAAHRLGHVYGEVIAFDVPERVRADARVQEAYLGSALADEQAAAVQPRPAAAQPTQAGA